MLVLDPLRFFAGVQMFFSTDFQIGVETANIPDYHGLKLYHQLSYGDRT